MEFFETEKRNASIKDKGFFEPLILPYDNATTTCQLVEGNNRLEYAMFHKIPFVPVKVVAAPLEDGYGILIPVSISPLCASNLGFNTLQNYPLHPYLPKQLSKKLKKQKMLNPYDIGYEQAVLDHTNPGLFEKVY